MQVIDTVVLVGEQTLRCHRRARAGGADNGDLFAADHMKKLQDALNVDGLIVGVVMEYGDWRGTINWGGVVGFSARLVKVDSGSLIWATSANRDMAMTNSTMVAHAASQDALKDLLNQLGK